MSSCARRAARQRPRRADLSVELLPGYYWLAQGMDGPRMMASAASATDTAFMWGAGIGVFSWDSGAPYLPLQAPYVPESGQIVFQPFNLYVLLAPLP